MKLKLEHEFELEVADKKYNGIFTDLTKKQVKSLDTLAPTKELKELKLLQRNLKKLKTVQSYKIR